jgi:hypothetical protein
MSRTATRSVEADALEAHDVGLCVLPVKHDGSKAPDAPTPDGKWERFQHERLTRDEVIACMQGRDGFGLVTGAISGNLECTEMEGRAVDDGTYTRFKEALCAAGLQELYDRICAGYMERSPSGGLHWLYRVEGEPVPSGVKLARRPSADGVHTLIETRAEGNFIVVASSGGRCHETGQPWVLELGGFASIATVTAQERADFHRVAAMFDEMPPPPPWHEPTSRLLATNTGDRPGDQYNASTTWDDVLGRAGWTRVYDKGEETAWRRPGKETGISATTNHRGTDTLKVFSTSTVLPTDGTLTRFGAFAYLEHGGDFIAAARAVAPAPRPKASVHGRAQAEKVEGVDDVNGIPADTPDSPSPYLPDEFWKTPLLPRLARIRAAAHQRQRSPDAVFHACLARIAAMAPYTLRIPPVVGANAAPCYFAALLSRSGYGKSSTADVASELTPANAQLVGPIPFGSGQGIVEAMFETSNKGEGKSKVKRHTKHNVFVYADEGDTLSALSANTNSTLQLTLRSIWSGSTIGDTNATEERRRIVRAGTYTYGRGHRLPRAGGGRAPRRRRDRTPATIRMGARHPPRRPPLERATRRHRTPRVAPAEVGTARGRRRNRHRDSHRRPRPHHRRRRS